MHKDILFKDDQGTPLETTSFLRNGDVRTVGVTIQDFGLGEVHVGAINSRGSKAAGGLYLRKEALPELIEALIAMSHHMDPSNDRKVRACVDRALNEVSLEEAEVEEVGRAFR